MLLYEPLNLLTPESRKLSKTDAWQEWLLSGRGLQEYDVALKLLLRLPGLLALQELTGTRVETWMDAEIPKIQNLRADLLGKAADGSLIHLELQSSNDGAMPLRMAEYALGIFRLYRQFPRQVLVYVGEAPLRMKTELRGPDFLFHYRAIDIRTLDGDRLLESTAVGDNVIAILAGLRDHKEAVRRIVERIAGLPGAEREASLSQLLVLSGLRHLEESVCPLRHKVAARESITWPALRQDPFNLNIAVPSPTVGSEA